MAKVNLVGGPYDDHFLPIEKFQHHPGDALNVITDPGDEGVQYVVAADGSAVWTVLVPGQRAFTYLVGELS